MDESRYSARVVESLDLVPEAEWQMLAGGNPFVSHRFLRLLQDTACVSPDKGWHPQYLLLTQGKALAGAAACYFKTHSWGEFVFDQSWARAFEQHGLPYYPKLIAASPFTPVQGPRLLARDADARNALARALLALCRAADASSAHALFVDEADRPALRQAGFMLREGVQFHWQNKGYRSTDEFLSQLSHDKRKKIRQDSKYVAAAGIRYVWLEGTQLEDSHLEFFYACYQKTYLEHGSSPYLSPEFFQRAHAEGALQLVLILALLDDQPVACALNVKGPDTLYGRYWSSMAAVKGLHFETCYLQSIAYCIEHGLTYFEGGAQGEHKMARGLLPVKTYSAHHVADPRFATAIEDFLLREAQAVDGYVDELNKASPFKMPANS